MPLSLGDLKTRAWKKYNITSALSPGNNVLGIARPTADPGLAAQAGGTLEVGAWWVDYYYWGSVSGIQSSSRHLGGNVLGVSTTSANRTIAITSLPAAVVRTGDVVSHLRILIKSPTSSVFRYAGDAEGQVALGTTATNISSDISAQFPAYAVTDANVPCRIMAASLTPTATDASVLTIENSLTGVVGTDQIHLQARLNGATSFVRFKAGGLRFSAGVSYTVTGTAKFGEIYYVLE